MHRDSGGAEQAVRPGEVNGMTAGSGITHSERFEQLRRQGGLLDGIQAWVALPDEREEGARLDRGLVGEHLQVGVDELGLVGHAREFVCLGELVLRRIRH